MGEGNVSYVTVTLLALLASVHAQEYIYDDLPTVTFNCLRPTSLDEWCQNNGTCPEEGGHCECEDPSEFAGPDCTIQAGTFMATCDPPCEHDGRCHLPEDETEPRCHCHIGFTGEQCQYQRVEHKCNHDGIDMYVAPFDGFLGYIYVVNHDDDPGCYFQQDAERGYMLTIPFEECGGPMNETDDNGDMLLWYNVIVQYDDLFVTDLDEEFRFVCKVLQSGGAIEFENDPMTFDRDGAIQQETVEQEFLPIEIVLTDASGAPIDGPVTLGQELMLTYTLVAGSSGVRSDLVEDIGGQKATGGGISIGIISQISGPEGYDSFRIEEVIVTNGLDDSMRRELPFVMDSCVTDQAYKDKKVVSDLSGDPATTVTLSFKAFKLQMSKELSFENKIKLCKGPGCNATDCMAAEAPFEGLGRKRRDLSSQAEAETGNAEEDSGKVETFWTKVEVRYPSTWHIDHESAVFPGSQFMCPAQSHEKVQLKDCLQSTGVLSIVIVLGMALIILAATVVGMCARNHCVSDRRPTTELKSFDNKAYA